MPRPGARAGYGHSADHGGVTTAVMATIDHRAGAVLERRGIPIVVPYVCSAAPVAVGLGVGAPAGVDLHIPVSPDRVVMERVDMTCSVPQFPAGQVDPRCGPVVQ